MTIRSNNKIFTYFVIISTLLLNLNSYSIQAQQSYIDSIEIKLEAATDSFNKSKYAYQLSYAHIKSNPRKGLAYIKKAINLLPKDSIVHIGQNYNVLGIFYAQIYSDSISVSIEYFKKSIAIFEANSYPKQAADSYNNLTQAYLLLKDYEKGLQSLFLARKKYEILKDTSGLASVHSMIFAINIKQNDYKEGLINAKKTLYLAFSTSILTPSILSPSSYDIATIQSKDFSNYLFNLGLVYLFLNELDSSSYYLEIALKFYKKIEDYNHIAITYNQLAGVYRKQDKLELATSYFSKAIALEEHLLSSSSKRIMRNTLAAIYFELKEYNKSIIVFRELQQLAKEANDTKSQLLASKGLTLNYSKLGDFEKAFLSSQEALSLKDSLIVKEKIKQIKDLEIKYETKYESEKKEQENLILSQDLNIKTLQATKSQQQFYTILGIFCLSLIIFILLIRQYRYKSKQQTTQLKHRLLRNQMSPHFIFNALTAIQSYVYKNKPKEAGLYLASFAKLVRAILENSRQEYITLEKEIQWLENYLKLQLLRFNRKFDYTIKVDEDIDLESLLIAPMLTQPFIENALEHGLEKIDYQGEINVQFLLEDDFLLVKVQDNGIGLHPKKTDESNHISLATKITKERLNFLNKGNSQKINFDVSSILPLGTLVAFRIPVKHIY